ncbi:hypothetical protein GCM10009624_18270 [Gordonia sinesedis]
MTEHSSDTAPDHSADGSPADSVARDLGTWMAQIPAEPTGRPAATEAARQRIGRLSRLFGRVLDEVADGHGLSVGDLEALSALQRTPGPCTPTTLAHLLGVTSGTISTRLRRLEAAGLVEAADEAVDRDGRSRPVRLTSAGRGRWSAATVDRLDIERERFAVLDDDDLARLNDALGLLLAEYERRYGAASRHDRTG